MIDAVIDTNVLVSGFANYLRPTNTTRMLITAWQQQQFALIVSEHILAELSRTLQKPYFRRLLSEEDSAAAILLVRKHAVVAPITTAVTGIASHPEDDAILATAVSAQANYVVTGDTMLLRLGTYQGITIISPRAFLDLLAEIGGPRVLPSEGGA